MTYTDETRAIAEYVRQHESTIINALHQHVYRMTEAAKTAREGYELGQANSQVLAAQDASVMTNNGFRMAAEIFEQDAAKARTTAEDIERLLAALYDEEKP